jgi:mannan endo-1,4-beta-mannosidase
VRNIFVITGVIIFVFALVIFFIGRPLKRAEVTDNPGGQYCLTGAFLADRPTRSDINYFTRDYGKKPYYVMIFIEWDMYPDLGVIKGILDEGCRPMITWEPWQADSRRGIDYDGLLNGKYDDYITDFARLVGSFGEEVCLRFAHEMNGNWYPWAGARIGPEKYRRMYRFIKDAFDREGVSNVKWIFSVNWEDVPPLAVNDFMNYYPGEAYVDYIGLDGYNWGDTQSWSRWMTFGELFGEVYDRIVRETDKPVIITEFSSASSGGDKARWIKEAMIDIKAMEYVKGFVLFNVSKEADWGFPAWTDAGRELKKQLEDPHFTDTRR